MKRLCNVGLVAILALSMAVPAGFAAPQQSQTQSQQPQAAPRIQPSSHRLLPTRPTSATAASRPQRFGPTAVVSFRPGTGAEKRQGPVRKKTSTPLGTGMSERA